MLVIDFSFSKHVHLIEITPDCQLRQEDLNLPALKTCECNCIHQILSPPDNVQPQTTNSLLEEIPLLVDSSGLNNLNEVLLELDDTLQNLAETSDPKLRYENNDMVDSSDYFDPIIISIPPLDVNEKGMLNYMASNGNLDINTEYPNMNTEEEGDEWKK